MKEKKQNKTLIVLLLSVLVMLIWGSLYPTGKLSYKLCDVDTGFYPNLLLFAGTRFTVSGAIILLVQGIRVKSVPKFHGKTEWIGIVLVTLFAVIFNYACTYYGLSRVESSKTALLKQSGILVFIFFSFLIIKEEKFSVGKGVGALLGVASIVALNFGKLGFSIGWGELFVVLSSCCSAAGNVAVKKTLKKADAIAVTGYSQFFGGIVLLALGLALGGRFSIKEVGDWLLMCYIVLATCVSYMLWYSIVQKNDLSKLFIVKLYEPMFAAVISAIILRENLLKWEYLVAFLCVGLALVISNLNLPKLFKRNKKTEEIKTEKERGPSQEGNTPPQESV